MELAASIATGLMDAHRDTAKDDRHDAPRDDELHPVRLPIAKACQLEGGPSGQSSPVARVQESSPLPLKSRERSVV